MGVGGGGGGSYHMQGQGREVLNCLDEKMTIRKVLQQLVLLSTNQLFCPNHNHIP